jgi:hypothetical protein
MSDFIKVLGDIKLSGSLSYANNLADFPANPDPRTIVVKEGMPYIFTELKNGSGFFTWMPLGLKHANYLHTQGAPSQTWTISHGFGTTNFAYFVYDSDHNMVIANIKYIDDNTSQILLSSAMTGTAVFFALGEISVPVISVASGLKLSSITLTEGANGRLEVDTQPVALMSDIVGLGNGLGTLGADFTAQLASKADQSTTYTMVQTDQLIGNVQSMIPDVTGFITSDAANSAIALKADQATTYSKTETDSRIQAVVGAAPAALDTLAEIGAQLTADESAATALTNAVSLKAPLASPTFTGTVSGISASMVGAYSAAQVDTALALKADGSVVAALAGVVDTKADKSTTYSKSEVDAAVGVKADSAALTVLSNVVSTKADKSGTYSKTEVDTAVALKADKSTTYTKTEVDAAVSIKADSATVTALSGVVSTKADKSSTYSKTEVDTAVALKADKSTTYSKTEVDTAVGVKADKSTTYTKTEVDTAVALKAAQATTYTKTETDARIQAVVGAAPAALDTLVEIAAQLASDESAVAALTSSVATKAPLASPTFTGTVSGITASMVGAYSTAQSDAALALKADKSDTAALTALTATVATKAPLASPVFTGTVSGITASMVGAYSTAQSDAALALKADASAVTALTATVATKAPLASPTFTGTVSGISASMVGAYTTAQVDAALAAKSTLASPAFTGTVTAPTPTAGDNTAAVATTAFVTNAVKVTSVAGKTGAVTLAKADVGLGNVDNTADASKPVSTAQAAAIALKADQATTYTKTETDSRIQAVVGAAPAALDTLVEIAAQLATDESAATALTNTVATKAPLASPTFTGTVSGISAGMVGAYTKAEVDTAVATKAPLASPTFTGTVSVSGVAIDGLGTIDTATLTTSATTASQVLDTNSSTLARTVKYLVQVTSGTSYQSIEMMVLHDGTTANLVQYANMSTGVDLATFDADVSGGNVRLLVTPVNAVTTFKAIKAVVAV